MFGTVLAIVKTSACSWVPRAAASRVERTNPLHADVFTIANTVPNMLYILLAGGVFNAVLVPQLVRAMRNDADRPAAQPDSPTAGAGTSTGAGTTA